MSISTRHSRQKKEMEKNKAASGRKREERRKERVLVPVERAIRASWRRVTKRRSILSFHDVSYKGSGFSRVARSGSTLA